MAGFANRVKTLTFPELTEAGEKTLFVALRDPKTMPMDALVPSDIPRGPDGQPLDPELAEERARDTMAKLIVGWHMFDAEDFSVDEDGNPLDQALLPLPATAASVAKLPMAVIQKINATIVEAVNPL